MNRTVQTADAPGDASPRGPWGFWSTLVWAAGFFMLGQAGIVVGIEWFSGASESSTVAGEPRLPLMLIGANAVQIAGLAVVARMAGWPVARYLALVPPRRRDVVIGFVALLLVIGALEIVNRMLGRESVDPFQGDAYRAARTAGLLPALWLAFVIVAPIGEEILFRGFIFRGWAASPLGPIGAIMLTSAIFALVHLQYDWFGMVQTGCLALLFGWLRWRSGSTLLTIFLHTSVNFVATGAAAFKVEGLV
jgi:membrane protease YdiL (CAAX protease family)